MNVAEVSNATVYRVKFFRIIILLLTTLVQHDESKIRIIHRRMVYKNKQTRKSAS